MSRTYVVEYLKKHKWLLYMVAFLYSIVHGSNAWRYVFRKDVHVKGAFLKRTKIYVHKSGQIFLGSRCQLNHCVLNVGDKGRVHIAGSQTCITKTKLQANSGGSITIGKDFSMEGGVIHSEHDAPITIGSHCMFSWGVEILSGDLHPIISLDDNHVINKAQAVTISDHVWIAANVSILKGSYIAPNAVVGSRSLVSGCLSEENALYLGVPARKVKSGIDWARNEYMLKK